MAPLNKSLDVVQTIMRLTAVFEGCAVHGFAERKLRVLAREPRRDQENASPGIVPECLSRSSEITFQLLAGPSYREFQRYVDEPSAIAQALNRSHDNRWVACDGIQASWLDFHWGDNLGHGSDVRLP